MSEAIQETVEEKAARFNVEMPKDLDKTIRPGYLLQFNFFTRDIQAKVGVEAKKDEDFDHLLGRLKLEVAKLHSGKPLSPGTRYHSNVYHANLASTFQNAIQADGQITAYLEVDYLQ